MPCPYNANNNGYTWCNCQQLGPPFGLCVADSWYCGYYCQYAPSWIFTAIAKGAMLCPIDPAQIDPYKPDIVFPDWVSTSPVTVYQTQLVVLLVTGVLAFRT